MYIKEFMERHMKKRVTKSFTLLNEVANELEKQAREKDLATSRYLEMILLRALNINLEENAHEN